MIKNKGKGVLVVKDDKLTPTKGTENALCYDLRASHNLTIKSGEVKLIGLGVKTNFTNKLYVRSSSPIRKGLMLANGVGIIDADYRGEVLGQLYNFTDKDIIIEKYERCIQMEVLTDSGNIDKIYNSEDDYTNWENIFPTNRGKGGFGSTGK